MNAEEIIRVHGLTRIYDGRAVVDQVTFAVPAGRVFGFLGLNGAGKTTTIKMLTGRLLPTRGSAEVLGLDPSTEEKALARRIGVIGDELGLYRDMSVLKNLQFFAALYDLPAERAQQVIEVFGLEGHERKKISALSKGLTQRARLAKCILHDPELIFLDEPTTGLDIDIAREIRTLIRFFRKQGKTIFLTTHNMAEVEELCDDIAIIDRGLLKVQMSMTEVRRHHAGTMVIVEFADRREHVPLTELGAFLSRNPGVVSVRSEEGSAEDLFLDVIGRADVGQRV